MVTTFPGLDARFISQNVFDPYKFDPMDVAQVQKNNLLLDYDSAKRNSKSLRRLEGLIHQATFCVRPMLEDFFAEIQQWDTDHLWRETESAKHNCLRMVALMLTGYCDMNCPVCFTDRKKNPWEMGFKETKKLLNQARKMGATLVYTTGEGEPLYDNRFSQIAEYVKKHGMSWIIFTNGLKIDEEFAKKYADYPIYLYIKYWSADPQTFFELTRPRVAFSEFKDQKLEPIELEGRTIFAPRAISTLLRFWPSDRVGIEALVSNQNFDSVFQNIIPYVLKNRLKIFIEPIIHSGGCACDHSIDLTKEQQDYSQPFYSRDENLCSLRHAYMAIVDNKGNLLEAQAIGQSVMEQAGVPLQALRLVQSNGMVADLLERRYYDKTYGDLRRLLRYYPHCACNDFASNTTLQEQVRQTLPA